MKFLPKIKYSYIFFVLIFALPNLFFFHNIFLSSLSVSYIFSIVLFFISSLVLPQKIKFSTLFFIHLLLLFLFSHSIIIYLDLGVNNNQKLFLSILYSFIYFYSVLYASKILSMFDDSLLRHYIYIIFYILFVILVCNSVIYLLFDYQLYNYAKAFWPFREPAIFSIYFCPIFHFILNYCNYKTKFRMLLVTIVLSIIIKSFLLLVSLLFIALLNRQFLLLFYLFLSFGIILITSDFFGPNHFLFYFIERVNLENISNLSLMTYIHGYSSAIEALKHSIIGIGFQQMGYNDLSALFTEEVLSFGFANSSFDGSFLFSKLCTEFGIFGILITIFYLFYFCRSFKILYMPTKYIHKHPKLLLKHIFILHFFIEFFFRTQGYFTPSVFLFLAFGLLNEKNYNKK